MCIIIIRVLWETNSEMKICMQVAHWGSAGIALVRKESRTGQREKMNKNEMATETSANPMESHQAGMTLQNGLELRHIIQFWMWTIPREEVWTWGRQLLCWGQFPWKGSAVTFKDTILAVLKGGPGQHHMHMQFTPCIAQIHLLSDNFTLFLNSIFRTLFDPFSWRSLEKES